MPTPANPPLAHSGVASPVDEDRTLTSPSPPAVSPPPPPPPPATTLAPNLARCHPAWSAARCSASPSDRVRHRRPGRSDSADVSNVASCVAAAANRSYVASPPHAASPAARSNHGRDVAVRGPCRRPKDDPTGVELAAKSGDPGASDTLARSVNRCVSPLACAVRSRLRRALAASMGDGAGGATYTSPARRASETYSTRRFRSMRLMWSPTVPLPVLNPKGSSPAYAPPPPPACPPLAA